MQSLPLVLPMAHNITAFALGLQSAHEGEHVAFGLLNLANFTSDDVLQFHPFTFELCNFILFYGGVKFHCV
jgi:hypothetical protein